MTEGTKSYLIGCHQFFFHPVWVLLAWRLEYKSWPKWWELLCILLHDIGVCGRQYLSDDTAKFGHWIAGASLIWKILNRIDRLLPVRKRDFNVTALKGFRFCAGHCPEESDFPESKLFRADKRSWLVAPMWWLWSNYWIEWYSKGIGVTPPPVWKQLVAKNLKCEKPIGSHELYQNNRCNKN